MKPTKAQLAALELLPIQATLDRHGVFLERLDAKGGFIKTLRGMRCKTLDCLVQQGLAKKVPIADRRWKYERA